MRHRAIQRATAKPIYGFDSRRQPPSDTRRIGSARHGAGDVGGSGFVVKQRDRVGGVSGRAAKMGSKQEYRKFKCRTPTAFRYTHCRRACINASAPDDPDEAQVVHPALVVPGVVVAVLRRDLAGIAAKRTFVAHDDGA